MYIKGFPHYLGETSFLEEKKYIKTSIISGQLHYIVAVLQHPFLIKLPYYCVKKKYPQINGVNT